MNTASHSFSPELEVALEASRLVEPLILKAYKDGVQKAYKDDGTPVTWVDVEAERLIVNAIRQHFPGHEFLGEECGSQEGNRNDIWIIDPIDGTKNFVKRIPFFSTQIAYLRGEQLIVGVSNMPAIGETVFAERGHGTHLNGKKIKASNIKSLNRAEINLGGLNHFVLSGRGPSVFNVAAKCARVRGIGDAYPYHLVASGRCEAVVEAKIRIWDIAALAIIVEEAGGICTDINGAPIGPDTRTVICSNGFIHEELIDLFTKN